MPLSRDFFSFAKKATKRSFDTRADLDNKEKVSDKDYVISVTGETIESTAPKKEKKEYVIPMKEGATGSGLAARLKQLKTGQAVKQEGTEEDKKAAEAVLKDLENYKENLETEDVAPQIAVPVLERVPDSDEDFAKDVASRPEQSTLEDYDAMPVSHFGAALMRGMGWSEGTPIGLTNKETVKPIEFVARQPGQGLGADSKEMLENGLKSMRKRRLKPGEKIEKRYKTYYDKDGKVKHVKEIDENLSESPPDEMKVGAYVEVMSGFYKDFFGKVIALDDDTAHAVVQMAISDKQVSMSQHTLVVVTKNDYIQSIKSPATDKGKREARDLDSDSDESEPWLAPNIRVRVISKRFDRGKYYNEKVSILDVVSVDRCVCKTDDGKLLEDVPQKVLETVVPRHADAVVSIVQGKYRGHLGKVVERNKAKCRAQVQLLSNQSKVVRLDYNQISEYLGDLYDY